MKMLIRTFALSLLFVAPLALGHGSQLSLEGQKALFRVLWEQTHAPTIPDGPSVCFHYGGNTECLSESDIAGSVSRASQFFEQQWRESHPGATPEAVAQAKEHFTTRARNLIQALPQKSLALTGTAVEMAKFYGPGWVIYTALAEAVAHTVLFFIPPPLDCYVIQGFYFGTVGYAKEVGQALSCPAPTQSWVSRWRSALSAPLRELNYQWNRMRSVGVSGDTKTKKEWDGSVFSEEADWLFDNTAFWAEAAVPYTPEKRSPLSDLDFIFSSEATTSARQWRAFQHVNGLELLRTLMSGYIEDSTQARELPHPKHPIDKVLTKVKPEEIEGLGFWGQWQHAFVSEVRNKHGETLDRLEYYYLAKGKLGTLGSLIKKHRTLLYHLIDSPDPAWEARARQEGEIIQKIFGSFYRHLDQREPLESVFTAIDHLSDLQRDWPNPYRDCARWLYDFVVTE